MADPRRGVVSPAQTRDDFRFVYWTSGLLTCGLIVKVQPTRFFLEVHDEKHAISSRLVHSFDDAASQAERLWERFVETP